MATLKELQEVLGVDIDLETADVSTITEKINATYVPLAGIEKNKQVKEKIAGGIFGGVTTTLAKEFGLSSKDVIDEATGKNLPYEKLFEKVKNAYETKISELSAGAGSDETVKKLQKQLEAKGAELITLNGKYEQLSEEKNKVETEWSSKLKSKTINEKVGKAKATVSDKLSDDYHKNELLREGFETKFASEYDLDLDETETLVIKSKTTGEVVKSKKNAAKPATFEDIYIDFAEAKGIVKKNNGGNQKVPLRSKADESDASEVKIHPNAQKRAKMG